MASETQLAPAILCLPQSDMQLAQRIVSATSGELIRCGGEGQSRLQDVLPRLFGQGRPIIGLCASAILIRLVAPHLDDKFSEPPLLSISPDGTHIVPLLGGHRGANQIAKDIADVLETHAAITTASDDKYAFALDNPPAEFVCLNPDAAKSKMVKALAGESLRVIGNHNWLSRAGYVVEPVSDPALADIVVSNFAIQNNSVLTYVEKNLVLGMGCARGTRFEDLQTLVTRVLEQNNLHPKSVATIASIDVKADEQGLHDLAQSFGVPLRFFSAAELKDIQVPNPSDVVRDEVGTPSVSEAAASKFGPLLTEKQKSSDATLAIAKLDPETELQNLGRAQGCVHVVGIGPGEEAQRTASCVAALQSTTDWVGYGFYLDLVADLGHGQIEHRFGLGDEEPRVRHALELAAEGKNVALVCSGDAQIYAMGALVFELLQAEGERALSDGAKRVDIVTHPGVSAFQMASARAGALIGHDFCCISLSDLLTPRDDILMRLDAAAKGDFVTAFYNPRSQRRTDLIEIAKTTYLAHRPPQTPVIIARQLGRPEEEVSIVTLEEFDPEMIDMMTIVLFGSSQSRMFARGNGKQVTFTPRGYAKKKNYESGGGQ